MSVLRGKNNKECFLIGTAHIRYVYSIPTNFVLLCFLCLFSCSKESANQVVDAINLSKPDCVVIELDEERARRIRNPGAQDKTHNIFQEFLKDPSLFGNIVRMVYRFLRLQGFETGGEFKAALEECDKLKIPIVYGDRNARETMARIQKNFGFKDILAFMQMPTLSPEKMQKMSAMGSAFLDEKKLEEMKTRKQCREMVSLLSEFNPKLKEVLLDERDVILCDAIANAPGERVVAVVGMAHMDGIERRWKNLYQ